MAKTPCPPGRILRKGFTKKAHSRRSYSRRSFKRATGTIVPATKVRGSYVSRTYVPPTCVPDKGKPGKTPARLRILPKPEKEVSLRRYGYSTHKSEAVRHKALKKASQIHGYHKVLRRLNLLRNFQADPNAKDIMSKDVKFMSYLLSEYKKAEGIQSRQSSQKRSKSKSRKKSSSKKKLS